MTALEPIQSKDYDELTEFLSTFSNDTLGRDCWRQRLTFYWERNPAFDEDFPRGWILRADQRIVGCLGNVPLLMRVANQEQRVMTGAGWRVLEEYRNASFMLFMKALSAARNTILFNTTGSDHVHQMLHRLKFELLPTKASDHRSVIVINPEAVLQKKLSRLPAISNVPGLAHLGSYPMHVWQHLTLHTLQKAGTRGVKELVWAGPEFDDLWLRTEQLFATTNVRTSEIVNWLCFGHGGDRKVLLGCFDGDALQGFLIARTEARPQLRELEILDVWPPFLEAQVTERLFCGAIEYARQNAFDTITILHSHATLANWCETQRLLKLPVTRRDYFKLPASLSGKVDEPHSYFVHAQGDKGL